MSRGYSDPLDMTGPSPPIRTGTLSDTARPNPSPTTEILPCGRLFFVICLIPRCKAAIGCVEPMD